MIHAKFLIAHQQDLIQFFDKNRPVLLTGKFHNLPIDLLLNS